MNWLLAALLLLAPTTMGQEGAPALPLEPGRRWEYRGRARWTGPDQRVKAGPIHWSMLIVAGRDGPAGRAAVVRGWIQELAWYEPGRTPGFSLLLARNSRLYHMPTRDSSSAVASLAGAVESDSSLGQGWELVVDSGLAVGHIYGQDADRGNRPDTFYAWYVESRQAIRPEAARSFLGPPAVQWRLVYRTAPDHQIVDIVSGLGITRYVYGHHGTVADTDVKLVSVKMQR